MKLQPLKLELENQGYALVKSSIKPGTIDRFHHFVHLRTYEVITLAEDNPNDNNFFEELFDLPVDLLAGRMNLHYGDGRYCFRKAISIKFDRESPSELIVTNS